MHDDSEILRAERADDHERYLVAVHEAGHVVMSFRLELDVEEVSIVPVGDRLGVCRNAGCSEWTELVDPTDGCDREKEMRWRQLIVKHIQVSLAGPEAERLARGISNPEGAAGDEETVRLLTGLLGCGAVPAVTVYIDWLRSRTARYLTRPRVWYAIVAVARGLLRCGRMTGKEARVLYSRAAAVTTLMPRIDRVPWKTQSFSSWTCPFEAVLEE
jgi:hypothetical protein